MQQVGLLSLPVDVINYIFAHLSIPESAATRQLSTFFNKLDRTVEGRERFANMTVEDFTFIKEKGEKNWKTFLEAHQSSSLFSLIFKVYLSGNYVLWERPPKEIVPAIIQFDEFVYYHKYFQLRSLINWPEPCVQEIRDSVSQCALVWKKRFAIPEAWMIASENSAVFFNVVWQQTKNPVYGTYQGIAEVYGINSGLVAGGVKQLHAMAPHSSLAKFVLGLMHKNGKGVEKDLVKAVYWWRSAAEQGNADAQFALGQHYESEKNQQAALDWYRIAAIQNHPSACNSLGVAFLKGNGVEEYLYKAFRLFKVGAEKGNAGAQCNLGFMHQNGREIGQNYQEALRWFFLSAKQGNSNAQTNLAYMYINGCGVEKNFEEAVKWYRLAAKQNSCHAKLCLGILLQPSLEADQLFEEGRKTFDDSTKSILTADSTDLSRQILAKLNAI